jgi:monoamine oxidase
MDVAIAVVGAGVAGLAAAAEAQRCGCRVVVLEAAPRVGGRAWTTWPAALGGARFEQGATWLHSADRNPLVAVARAAGEKLRDARTNRQHYTFAGTRLLSPADQADYHAAWDRFEQTALSLLHAGLPDCALAEVARRLTDDPWAATVEAWEGSIVAAADADELSLLDWHDNLLDGGNLLVDGGLGDFVARCLAPPAGDIWLSTQVSRINWNGPAGRVALETTTGALQVEACIVTVSTGVLTTGGIRFDPALPEAWQDALSALPMGLALKVALRACSQDRLDLPSACLVDHQVARSGDPTMIFNTWPEGFDYVSGWIGGRAAWALQREGPAAAVDFTLTQLRHLFGSRVDKLFAAKYSVVTEWGLDPNFRGAYAFARPGGVPARMQLAQPLADGHLLIAGEACHAGGLAGTVGGAYASGIDAAKVAVAAVL